MIEKLKDWFFINSYSVSWRIDFGGYEITGNTTDDYGYGPYIYWFAKAYVKDMNKEYGEGTHWIVKES